MESDCSASSFATETTTDMGCYHSQQHQHSTDTAHTPQHTPVDHTHDAVHAEYSSHPVTKHAVPSTASPDQFADRELWREDQVQIETQATAGVGDRYTAGIGPSEILTSAQYGGRQFQFLYDESIVESEPQLHTEVHVAGVGGVELRGDSQATAGDVDEGWLT